MLSGNTVKYIQSLTHKKFRDQHNCFIAETPKVVEEFLAAGYKADAIYATEDWAKQEDPALPLKQEQLFVVKEYELKKISQLKTPRAVVGIFQIPDEAHPEDLQGALTLALDDIQDPGNVGTIIRIADWFGIKNILCSLHTANAYNPKVVQASMGSLAHVKTYSTDLQAFLEMSNLPVFAASLEGTSVFTFGKIGEGVLVIGNEGKGISPEVMAIAKQHLTIPRVGKAESLNAAIATGILLSHIVEV